MAPILVKLRAPLPLPPLKEPVAVVLEEVPVDEPDTTGVDVLLMVEPRPLVVREGGPPELRNIGEGHSTNGRGDTYMDEAKVPVPEVVEEDKELEEMC